MVLQIFSSVAVNNTVFVTLTNQGYIDFANNSLLHFRQAIPYAQVLMVCYDDKSFEWCETQASVKCVKGGVFGFMCDTIPQAKGYHEYYSQAFRMVCPTAAHRRVYVHFCVVFVWVRCVCVCCVRARVCVRAACCVRECEEEGVFVERVGLCCSPRVTLQGMSGRALVTDCSNSTSVPHVGIPFAASDWPWDWDGSQRVVIVRTYFILSPPHMAMCSHTADPVCSGKELSPC